jgi:hypothetical protein
MQQQQTDHPNNALDMKPLVLYLSQKSDILNENTSGNISERQRPNAKTKVHR